MEYSPQHNAKTIKEWREDERPRERLIRNGPGSLSDAELLAILIGGGVTGFSAIDAARAMLEDLGSVSNLVSCDIARLKKIRGIGDAKAITITAAIELSRRLVSAPFDSKVKFTSPEKIAEYYIPRLRGSMKETVRLILLNTANQMFKEELISEGTLNSSIIHPREVFKAAIAESAASIILIHNHPSGNTLPSQADIKITRTIYKAGELLSITLLDHIIIAGEKYTSLAELGYVG